MSKSQETLELFHSSGSWPVADGVHLTLVHRNGMLTDIVSKELDHRLVELIFLGIEVKMQLSQLLKATCLQSKYSINEKRRLQFRQINPHLYLCHLLLHTPHPLVIK